LCRGVTASPPLDSVAGLASPAGMFHLHSRQTARSGERYAGTEWWRAAANRSDQGRGRRLLCGRGGRRLGRGAGDRRFLGAVVRAVQDAGPDAGRRGEGRQGRREDGQGQRGRGAAPGQRVGAAGPAAAIHPDGGGVLPGSSGGHVPGGAAAVGDQGLRRPRGTGGRRRLRWWSRRRHRGRRRDAGARRGGRRGADICRDSGRLTAGWCVVTLPPATWTRRRPR
jgi:hypothetical protein